MDDPNFPAIVLMNTEGIPVPVGHCEICWALVAAYDEKAHRAWHTATFTVTPTPRHTGEPIVMTDAELARAAQRFYEVASDSGEIEFKSMTSKPAVIDALSAAIAYINERRASSGDR